MPVPICPPIDACACCGRWTIGPGQTLPLLIDWSVWLASIPGFVLRSISKAELLDYTGSSGPVPADPAKIDLVSGLPVDPTDALPGFTKIIADAMATQNIVQVADDTPVGSLYRLNITALARDCECRELVLPYCVMINVTAC